MDTSLGVSRRRQYSHLLLRLTCLGIQLLATELNFLQLTACTHSQSKYKNKNHCFLHGLHQRASWPSSETIANALISREKSKHLDIL